jgi:hypothetical protein
LVVHDVQGREVAVLADAMEAAGPHAVLFDVDGLRPGVYFCSLSTPEGTSTDRVVVVR